MCPSGTTCLPTDCKNPTQCVGLVQSGHASSHQNVTCSCHDIAANCPVGVQQ